MCTKSPGTEGVSTAPVYLSREYQKMRDTGEVAELGQGKVTKGLVKLTESLGLYSIINCESTDGLYVEE